MAYLSTTVNWDTIRSLTHPAVSKAISDNITANIKLFYFLNRVGNKEYENGGAEYQFPVFKELASAQAYTGATVLDTLERDPVTICYFSRKQFSQDITLSGTNLLKNSGNDDTAIVHYIAAQIEMAQEGMKDTLANETNGIMSASADSALGITGLRAMLSDSSTTGTYGGLSRATYAFWRQKSNEVTTGFNTDGLVSLGALYFDLIRGDESPMVIVLTKQSYINMDRALTGTIMYNQPSPKTAFGDVGFEHINFRGTPVIFDAKMPANRGMLLNLKYLRLLVHRDRDMAVRDFIAPANQDAIIGRLLWAGNVVCNNLAAQGLLYGLPDTWA